ncbi:NAT9 acetyltransferase, partial [Centropus bengalensis]|nr:NAT9 acetyltransferase [Centropus bengalensis]
AHRRLPKGFMGAVPALGLAGDTSGALGLSRSAEVMKINENTVLQGQRVTLVPYTAAHVPRYVPRVLGLAPARSDGFTDLLKGSVSVSSECTFIVLDTERWAGQACTDNDCMVGDVNLFLTDTEDPTLGEIEIMIAEPGYRGRGFGKEATLMMMSYGVAKLGITKFEAKIGQENEASICMFKKLRFKEVAVNSVFQEVTLRLDVGDQERRWLLEQTSHVKEKSYVAPQLPA